MYGKRILTALEKRGLEPSDLIRETGFSGSTVYKRLRESDLPTDFIDTVCDKLKIPREEIYFSPEQLAALSEINPVISPIAEELNFAAENYNRTWQTLIFGGVLAMLKKHRQLFESGEWK